MSFLTCHDLYLHGRSSDHDHHAAHLRGGHRSVLPDGHRDSHASNASHKVGDRKAVRLKLTEMSTKRTIKELNAIQSLRLGGP